MTRYKRIAIDTPKSVLTVHCADARDRPVLRTNRRRGQLLPFFRKLAATEIAIESCCGSHQWARELRALGHTPRLVPPQYVKPSVKRGKNDRNDAEAICEAAGLFGTGSRTPSGPAAVMPRQLAGHMIAVDPPVRILNEALESKGPSAQDTWYSRRDGSAWPSHSRLVCRDPAVERASGCFVRR